MTTVTLSEIKAAQDRVAEMIATFEAAAAKASSTMLIVREAAIELRAGETYAGLLLDDAGAPSHHLILLPGQVTGDWEEAKAWAQKAGGELPTRREQSLLFANCKGKFEAEWYWSSEQFSASLAWILYFYGGDQGGSAPSAELRARAVRRFAA